MTRWGYTNTWVSSNDPREFGRSLPGYFDAMVIDAPCSGSGLFRKDNAAINEWSEDAVNLCSARQQRIIADVWDALKPNGYLFYATCSYSPAEDEQILDWINDNYPTHSVAIDIPSEWGIVATQSPKHKATGYRFSPDKVTGEGFFIAILQKTEASSNTFFYPRIKNAHSKKAEELSRFLLTNEKAFSIIENDRKEFTAIYPQHQPDWHLLTNALYLRKAGILLGEPAQKDWIPAHDVALAIDKSKELEIINLSEQAALHFLKKENFDCPMLNKGWHIVGYNNQGLGWIKSLSNRVNNYLPKHWRIRMELPNDNSE
jgi:NOL1/NOP2/fmu family ribosome biogenesis protein